MSFDSKVNGFTDIKVQCRQAASPVSHETASMATSALSGATGGGVLERVQIAVSGVFSLVKGLFSGSLSTGSSIYVPPPSRVISDSDFDLLTNSSGPAAGLSTSRYTMVSLADEDAYTSILKNSEEINGYGLIRGKTLHKLTIPEMFETSTSLFPEIDHARAINWFLSSKNIRNIKNQTAKELASDSEFMTELRGAIGDLEKDFIEFINEFNVLSSTQNNPITAYQAARSGDSPEENELVKRPDVVVQKERLESLCSKQFVLDFLRPGEEGQKSYTFFLRKLDSARIIQENGTLIEEEREGDLITKVLRGVEPREKNLVMTLVSQNSGITAWGIIDEWAKDKDPELLAIQCKQDTVVENYTLNRDADGSLTFLFDYKATVTFVKEESQEDREVHAVFSINLKNSADLYYSINI